MLNSLLLVSALICYLIATLLIARHIRSSTDENIESNFLKLAYIIGCIGTAVHLTYAYDVSLLSRSLNFSLSSMAVLVSGILVLIYILGSLAMPIRRLGVLVFPFTMLSLIFSVAWESQASIQINQSPAFSAHILISIIAYSLLAIATIQALLYVYQERQIKKHANPAMLMALPPLQTMEQLLFRLVGLGFILLTLTLLSGAVFSQEIFGHAFAFKHHTVLAVLGWLVFAILLFKRIRNGLRGSRAVVWTIAGFLLIQLGYFGTKFVSESLSVH